MANQAQWQAQGTGISCQGECWKYNWQTNGQYSHQCQDQAHTQNCQATIRFPNGDKVRYTFACDANPATAGGVSNDGTFITVTNFIDETWL